MCQWSLTSLMTLKLPASLNSNADSSKRWFVVPKGGSSATDAGVGVSAAGAAAAAAAADSEACDRGYAVTAESSSTGIRGGGGRGFFSSCGGCNIRREGFGAGAESLRR